MPKAIQVCQKLSKYAICHPKMPFAIRKRKKEKKRKEAKEKKRKEKKRKEKKEKYYLFSK